MVLNTVKKHLPNRYVVQTEAELRGACATCVIITVMWSNGLFEAASTCDVGQQCLGDLRVFNRKDWGATRGGTWL